MRIEKQIEQLAAGEVRDVGVVAYDLEEGDSITEATFTVYDKDGNVLQAEGTAVATGSAPTVTLTGMVSVLAEWPRELHVDFTYALNAETVKSRLIVYKVN